MWTTSSADGSGMEMVKNWTPDCAGGQVFRNRVMLHFDAPQTATADSGCPESERFYSQMIVAYPDAAAVPQFGPGTDDTVGATEYNGMPALEQFEMDPRANRCSAATRTDATVLLLGHTNRVHSPNARDRYGATYALRQKARMTLFAQQDQDGHLVVGPEKANGAPIKPASKFSITGVPFFQPNPENDGTVPLLTYVAESDKTSREHLEDSFADRRTGADKPDPKLWLALLLVDGPRWAEEIEEAAQKAKITKYGLKSAKKDLKVRSQQGGSPKRWFWFLPQHDGQTPQPAEGQSGVDSLYCSKVDPSTSDQFSACFDPAPDDSSTSESRFDSEVESSTAPELKGSVARLRCPGSISENKHRDQRWTLPRREPHTPPPALPRSGVCDTIPGSCDTPSKN